MTEVMDDTAQAAFGGLAPRVLTCVILGVDALLRAGVPRIIVKNVPRLSQIPGGAWGLGGKALRMNVA